MSQHKILVSKSDSSLNALAKAPSYMIAFFDYDIRLLNIFVGSTYKAYLTKILEIMTNYIVDIRGNHLSG